MSKQVSPWVERRFGRHAYPRLTAVYEGQPAMWKPVRERPVFTRETETGLPPTVTMVRLRWLWRQWEGSLRNHT